MVKEYGRKVEIMAIEGQREGARLLAGLGSTTDICQPLKISQMLVAFGRGGGGERESNNKR